MEFNKIDNKMIQIYGNFEGVKVSGFAGLVYFEGRHVWMYSLQALHGSKMITMKSSSKDGTMSTEKLLRNRVEREILKIRRDG